MKVWNYNLPNKKYEGWAQIMIREDGMFAAVSDFGNYSYRWTHTGTHDVREFFLDAEQQWQYFARKLNPILETDHKASFAAACEYLLEQRRSKDMNREDAREAWDRLAFYSNWDEYLASEEGFTDEDYSFTVQVENAQVVRFAKEVMPRLVELIRVDLAGPPRRHIMQLDILKSRGFYIEPEIRKQLHKTLGSRVPSVSIFDPTWPEACCDVRDGRLYPHRLPWSGGVEILAMTLKKFEGSAEVAVRWDNGDLTALVLKDHIITERGARLVVD